jgi:hypothetical protein
MVTLFDANEGWIGSLNLPEDGTNFPNYGSTPSFRRSFGGRALSSLLASFGPQLLSFLFGKYSLPLVLG